jgi:hypothetical protein
MSPGTPKTNPRARADSERPAGAGIFSSWGPSLAMPRIGSVVRSENPQGRTMWRRRRSLMPFGWALGVVWLLSIPIPLGLEFTSGPLVVAIERGAIHWQWATCSETLATPGVRVEPADSEFQFAFTPALAWVHYNCGSFCVVEPMGSIPLWFGFLPSIFLFWRGRGRAKPHECAKCRYDLRGLKGGMVCPECGAPRGSQSDLKPESPERPDP